MSAFECFVVAGLLNLRAAKPSQVVVTFWWHGLVVLTFTLDAAVLFVVGLAKLVLP